MSLPTIYLENNFGEKTENFIFGGTSVAANAVGVPIFLQKLNVGFAALNTAGSGVALSLGNLPAKAIITNVFFNVLTSFTDNGTSSDADTSTISAGAVTQVDLKAAIAISNGANPWNAGFTAGIPVGTAATFVKPAAAAHVTVTWTHGSGNSTALVTGNMDVFVEYVQGT